MNGPDKRILELARKLASGNFSEAERQAFEQWYAAHDDTFLEEDSNETEDALKARLLENIRNRRKADRILPRMGKIRQLAGIAASLLILTAVGTWMMMKNRPENLETAVSIIPGGNKAVLTLANGEKVILDSVAHGKLADAGNTVIIKTADGQLSYQPGHLNTTHGQKNTISTPKGGQYWINLADGTRILLNAASTLTYSVSMSEAERVVELNGEAYFEVSHNARRPFRVKVAGTVIEDVGTTFLVNSYLDEPAVTTTLLEGAVRVCATHNPQKSYQLAPGQQASVISGSVSISDVDTEQALAWKEGYFTFDGESISAVMRKIARWYDIEVVYEGPAPTDRFGGTISRFESFKEVLHKLELTGRVRFTIEGRRVIVKS